VLQPVNIPESHGVGHVVVTRAESSPDEHAIGPHSWLEANVTVVARHGASLGAERAEGGAKSRKS